MPIEMVGARGFEPPTSCSQGRRASQTALRPVIKLNILQENSLDHYNDTNIQIQVKTICCEQNIWCSTII